MLGAAEGHDHNLISFMPNHTSTWSRETGPLSLERAGLAHSDIDLTMIYDSFTYTTLVTLEGLGFCGPGEGPDFVANQRTAPGGEFALNTNGGGLSYSHPGMYGSSCWWKRCGKCATNVANGRCTARVRRIRRRRPAL